MLGALLNSALAVDAMMGCGFRNHGRANNVADQSLPLVGDSPGRLAAGAAR
jgi:hypothetical protein